MEITAETLILVGVICVVLGFMASMLLGTLRDEVEEPVPGAPDAPPGGAKGRYSLVTRLWRENSTGRLVVEMDGKSLVTSEPLTEADRAALEQAARDLRAWLGMGLAEPRVVAEPAPPVSDPAVTDPPATAPPAAASRSPEEDLRSAWAEVQPREEAPVQPRPVSAPRTTGPLPPLQGARAAAGRSGKLLGDEPAVVASVNKSIVMQIEDILQDMLYDSPLRSRGIHLTEDPVRGVIVSVGGKQYEGIDSVPDPEVKAFIRSAVVAWEQSQ
jgi:hypothetical protein